MAFVGSAQAGAAELNSGATVNPSASSTGEIVKVGTGWTDVSSLTIVGTIDPATGAVTMLAQPQTPTATSSHLVTPQITHPDCNGRIDFYRIISSAGNTECFANSGIYTLSSGNWPAMYLCPGNNNGRTEYLNGNTNTWSLWRGPMADYNSCYSFGSDVRAFAVQIA